MLKSPRSIKQRKIHESCHHYWIIEPANSKTSLGQCKYCGMTKWFLNEYKGKYVGALIRKRISDTNELVSENDDDDYV
jgi:hypothetical protein